MMGKNTDMKAGEAAVDMTAAVPDTDGPASGEDWANINVMEMEASVSLVICAYPGTEDVMDKIWEKMCPDVAVRKVVTVSDDKPLQELLSELVADNGISDRFILVPANCVPCAHVSFEELHLPLVFRNAKGELHYRYRLPVPVSKEILVEILGNADAADDEAVMEKYISSIGRPVVASFKEGNIVTPVLRGTPCENVVMEAILRKKYIVANPVGFAAIQTLLVKALLE